MVDVIFGGTVLAASYLVATLAFDAIESAVGWILRDLQPTAGRSPRAALFASTLLSTLLVIGFLGRFGHYALLLILLGPPLPALGSMVQRRFGRGHIALAGEADGPEERPVDANPPTTGAGGGWSCAAADHHLLLLVALLFLAVLGAVNLWALVTGVQWASRRAFSELSGAARSLIGATVAALAALEISLLAGLEPLSPSARGDREATQTEQSRRDPARFWSLVVALTLAFAVFGAGLFWLTDVLSGGLGQAIGEHVARVFAATSPVAFGDLPGYVGAGLPALVLSCALQAPGARSDAA